MAALRVGEYKIIWGSRTQKDTWFPALEEPVNKDRVHLIRMESPYRGQGSYLGDFFGLEFAVANEVSPSLS